MATLREVGLFVWSVLTHWQALATGGIITGLLLVAEKVFDWPLSRQAFIVIMVVMFLLAAVPISVHVRMQPTSSRCVPSICRVDI
jgi:hypothetical protein